MAVAPFSSHTQPPSAAPTHVLVERSSGLVLGEVNIEDLRGKFRVLEVSFVPVEDQPADEQGTASSG